MESQTSALAQLKRIVFIYSQRPNINPLFIIWLPFPQLSSFQHQTPSLLRYPTQVLHLFKSQTPRSRSCKRLHSTLQEILHDRTKVKHEEQLNIKRKGKSSEGFPRAICRTFSKCPPFSNNVLSQHFIQQMSPKKNSYFPFPKASFPQRPAFP